MSFPDAIPPETKIIMAQITDAIRNGDSSTVEESRVAWKEITARILKLETERKELRAEVERLKADKSKDLRIADLKGRLQTSQEDNERFQKIMAELESEAAMKADK